MKRRNDNTQNLMLAALAGAGICAAATAAVRWSRHFDFRGKVVVITGGSRGLGLILARLFAEEGARVAICGRDPETLHRAVDDLGGRGAEVVAVPCDVSSREDVERMIAEVVGRFGGVDVLVNNAGTITVGPMETMTVADYEEAMKIHFWGPFHTTMAALPHLRKRGGGRIVNISSIGGKIAVPHLLPYSSSKFALTGFSEGLRAELQKDNIFVTTVCPGLMRTGSPRNAMFKGRHREEYAWFHLGDAIPGSSMSAIRAGKKIVNACRFGRAEIVLSLQAKAAATLNALFPGLTSQIAAMVHHHVLPAPGGIGEMRATGSQSESTVTRSWLTGLSRAAERANNELDVDVHTSVAAPGLSEGAQ
jgi:NAD(P)-dependent dehydrogenase (short-subunit alcohol dehydrogenase family)